MAANGNPAAPERPGKAMRAVRLAFLVLAVAGALWLFLVYQPPRKADRPGREKVVFWHMWTSHWAEVVERIVERFNDSQDRWQVVPLTVIGGSLKTLIATAGGDPPDCMAQWEPVIPAWAEREALVPLETLMSPTEWETLRDKMYPAVRAIGTYQGHFYGLSTGMNIWALYYRPDHFRAAGLDPDRFPETLEALWDTAAKLYQTDAGGHITRIGFFPQMYPHYVALFGGTFYDEATGGPVFLDPKNVEALAWMRRWASEYDFEKVQGFQQSLTATFGASWPFISGAFSIAMEGQWRVQQLAQFAPEMEYRTVPMPPPKGGKPLACWSNGNFMVIPKGAKHKEGAWAFMRFWSGVDEPERAAEFYTWGGWLPITPDVANAPIYQAYCEKYPQFRTFLEVMASPNVQVSPPVPVQAYMMNRLDSVRDKAMRGTLTPSAALEEAAADTRREMENLRVARQRSEAAGSAP